MPKELIYSKISRKYYLFKKDGGERFLDNISFGDYKYDGVEMIGNQNLPYDVVFEILKNVFIIWGREGRIIDLFNLCLINKYHMDATYKQMGYPKTKLTRLKILKISKSFKIIDMVLDMICQQRRLDETGFVALTLYRDPTWVYSSKPIQLSEIENVDIVEITEPTLRTEKIIKVNLGNQYFDTMWVRGSKDRGVITYDQLFYPTIPICVVTRNNGVKTDIHSDSFLYLKSILNIYFNLDTTLIVFTTAASNFDVNDGDSDNDQLFNFEDEINEYSI